MTDRAMPGITLARIGRPAPQFQTKAFYQDDIIDVDLTAYRGRWVVLFFYPGDFTFVCPCELAAIADRYDEFQALEADVLALSTDSVWCHKAWHENELAFMVESDEGIPYPMLSDMSGEIGKLYNVFDDASHVNLRGTFIIDPDGTLQASEVLNEAVGRSVDELLRKLQAFKETRDTGEVMPADWEPGKKTLTPGADMVGKVKDNWRPGD